MDISDIRIKVLELLSAIAPDIDAQSIDPRRPFRDQFDFDSMDALHLATAVSEVFRIEIPERDYASLASLDGAVEYVQSHLAPMASQNDAGR